MIIEGPKVTPISDRVQLYLNFNPVIKNLQKLLRIFESRNTFYSLDGYQTCTLTTRLNQLSSKIVCSVIQFRIQNTLRRSKKLLLSSRHHHKSVSISYHWRNFRNDPVDFGSSIAKPKLNTFQERFIGVDE